MSDGSKDNNISHKINYKDTKIIVLFVLEEKKTEENEFDSRSNTMQLNCYSEKRE